MLSLNILLNIVSGWILKKNTQLEIEYPLITILNKMRKEIVQPCLNHSACHCSSAVRLTHYLIQSRLNLFNIIGSNYF